MELFCGPLQGQDLLFYNSLLLFGGQELRTQEEDGALSLWCLLCQDGLEASLYTVKGLSGNEECNMEKVQRFSFSNPKAVTTSLVLVNNFILQPRPFSISVGGHQGGEMGDKMLVIVGQAQKSYNSFLVWGWVTL